MTRERIIVGATGDDASARSMARQLRDAGHEVVFVGGGQTAAHLVRAAVAEDASRIMIDADPEVVDELRALCAALGDEGPVVDFR